MNTSTNLNLRKLLESKPNQVQAPQGKLLRAGVKNEVKKTGTGEGAKNF
jgi:hypothetical protein